MQTAIHFCSVLFEENLMLNPISAWDDKDEKVMFIVRTELPLENAAIQLVAEDKTIWESPLRLVPTAGLVHPFSADDDHSIVYVSSHFVTKANLKVETVNYSIQVVDALNETVINELPFMIEFFQEEKPQQSQPANLSVIDSILSADTTVSASVDNVTYSYIPTHGEAIVTTSVDSETDSFFATETFSEEPVEEVEIVAPVYTDELHYNVQLIAGILTAANQTDYSVDHKSQVEVALNEFQIVVEKMGTKYISVINDPSARPMFFLENGQFMKEWEGDFSSYLEWLKDQLSLMFNITLEESNSWEILLITENETVVENERVTIIDRAEAVSILNNYSAILDVTEEGTLLSLNFVDGAQVTVVFNNLTSIERLQEVLPSWEQLLAGNHILPTGLLCDPEVLQGLSEQLKEASSYRRTSLAWELVIQLSKLN